MSAENGFDGFQGDLDYLLNKINGTEVTQHTGELPIEEDLQHFLNTINRTEATKQNHDVTKVCPLCNSLVRFYYIHFNEMLLMCENTSCEFPFGYEELQFTKVEPAEYIAIPSDFGTNYDNINKKIKSPVDSTSLSTSIPTSLSTNNQTQLCTGYKEINEQPHENKNLTKNKAIDKNLMAIKELHKKCKSLDRDTVQAQEQSVIKNEKWIEKLHNLQSVSGVKLLKPEEMGLCRRTEPKIGLGELKIDIDSNNESGLKINVRIENPNQNIEEVKYLNQNMEEKENLNQNMEEVENLNQNTEALENTCQNMEITETEAKEQDLPVTELFEVIVIQDEEPTRFIEPI